MKTIGNLNIINISLLPDFLEEIDGWAKKTSRTRSDFFREAARRFILVLKKEEKYDNS